ncbi:MAG: CvpA family protein [Planctomycetia bacterium]
MTVILVGACAAVLMNEGVFTAACVLLCVVFGGLIAFNFFEPVAAFLDGSASFMGGYTDFITLMVLFTIAVTLLRLATEQTATSMIDLPGNVHRIGGFILGAWTGWIMAGILIAAMQTLPLHQNFMGYDYRNLEKGNGWNADRYWLAFVQRASADLFEPNEGRGFDPRADFVVRYHKYRRLNDDGQSGAGTNDEQPVRRSTPSASGGGRRSL